MTEFRLSRIAELELLDAAAFLEKQSPGLGVNFTRAIKTAISAIVESPMRLPEIEPGIRKYSLLKHRHIIAYRIVADEVIIIAIMHVRRKPVRFAERPDH